MGVWRSGFAGLVLFASPALATGNSGAPEADIMLGPVQTYGTEAEARAACGRDVVVWAERYAGYYFKPADPRYGAAPMGAFACQGAAEGANYWDIDPTAAVMGYHGKSFPSALRGYGS